MLKRTHGGRREAAHVALDARVSRVDAFSAGVARSEKSGGTRTRKICHMRDLGQLNGDALAIGAAFVCVGAVRARHAGGGTRRGRNRAPRTLDGTNGTRTQRR